MEGKSLRFRQIHLDFHTSEHITGIGSAFDPDEFATTLARAHVNSITCFARCHHGWFYFDSKLFPERRHPHLERNLLAEQIEACHARGIRVPIYTTIQWDHLTATEHPEWRVVEADGKLQGTPPYEAGFYRQLCLNSPYRGFLKEHVREILQTLPTDGLFLDIVLPVDCSCRFCRAKMEQEGLDPTDPLARAGFGIATLNDFKRDMTAHIRSLSKECTIYYNAGHVGPRHRGVRDAYTHFELETLPSGQWGYLHFPVTVRYCRTLGLDYLGQTGKFHTSWGDFHSFKNLAALEYECFRMLAMGAKCLVGDQLHPNGRIDEHVYRLIGQVYEQVEAKERWCAGAVPVTEIGVLTPEEFMVSGSAGNLPPAIKGASRILEEGGHQFDVLDSDSDFSRYKVLILPDRIPVDAALARKIGEYLSAGGSLLASFLSGLSPDGSQVALAPLGIRLNGAGLKAPGASAILGQPFERGDHTEYLRAGEEIRGSLPDTELAMYMKGMDIRAEAGTDVLADTVASYFDRDYRTFCSHRQTPSSGRIDHPAVVRKGRAIYFAHPVFSQYNRNAPRWCKLLVLNALALLLPEPIVRHDGPSTLQLAVNAQESEKRWVVHLLHYIPERRGEEFDVIEDVIPLFDLSLSLRLPRPVREIRTAPQGERLAHQQRDGRTTVTVPSIRGHQMLEVLFR